MNLILDSHVWLVATLLIAQVWNVAKCKNLHIPENSLSVK